MFDVTLKYYVFTFYIVNLEIVVAQLKTRQFFLGFFAYSEFELVYISIQLYVNKIDVFKLVGK